MTTIRVTLDDDLLAQLDDYVAAVNASREKNWGLPPLRRNAVVVRFIERGSEDAHRVWSLSTGRGNRRRV